MSEWKVREDVKITYDPGSTMKARVYNIRSQWWRAGDVIRGVVVGRSGETVKIAESGGSFLLDVPVAILNSEDG